MINAEFRGVEKIRQRVVVPLLYRCYITGSDNYTYNFHAPLEFYVYCSRSDMVDFLYSSSLSRVFR